MPIRELRDLTRYRESLVREQTALANRIQKLIESANIKLGQVASDALGVSGKLMLRALAAGETDAEQMSHLAQRTLKRKQPQLRQALEGRFTQAQRWILASCSTSMIKERRAPARSRADRAGGGHQCRPFRA